MSEAWGVIFIKTPDKSLTKALRKSKQSVSGELIENILRGAGIEMPWIKEEVFSHEGISKSRQFTKIEIFGDEWMHVMQALVQNGKDLELYGHITHEYGATEYYALSHEGKSFYEVTDIEGGEDIDENAVTENWLSYIPGELEKQFSGMVSSTHGKGSGNAVMESVDSKLTGRFKNIFRLLFSIKETEFSELVGVWDVTGAHPGRESDESYVVIRSDHTVLYYFKEPGSGYFQYNESSLQPQGRNRYNEVFKGAVLLKEIVNIEDICGIEFKCYFIENDYLVEENYADELFDDAPYDAYDIYRYPRAGIRESDILPICSREYLSCD